MPQNLVEQLSREQQIAALEKDWATNPRWKGIKRGYSAADVVRLRGSFPIEHTLARRGAEKLWSLLHTEDYINCLGALTGGQAMQQVKAGIKAIYLSGWQVAADNNSYASMYPDQSLYPVDSVPKVVERINNSFRRADEIQWSKGTNPGDKEYTDYFAPIVADAEAGFGGVLNAFELMKAMIAAGAGGVHFEDQLASVKKCGHMGGKVLVPTTEACQKLIAARMAADVCGVPTLVIARTDAEAADLLTSDYDENDKPFLTGERTAEGFYKTKKGMAQAISRAVAYAEYADLVWCETGTPDLEFARKFAEAVHAKHPGKLLAYNSLANCWPTTAHLLSTGRKTWTMPPSPNSRKNSALWVTSTSSSLWLAFTPCGTTCSIWHKPTFSAACLPTLRRCKNPNLQHAIVVIPSCRTNKKWAPVTSTK
ncbi:MAG: Isocitrate lyase [Pseudomonadota bacterium]